MLEFMDALKEARLSVNQAKTIKEDDLYVMNTSDLNRRYQIGEIILKFSRNGKMIKVPLPDSWVPILITNYVPKTDLFADLDFVNLVERGIITIVKSTIAKEILETPQAEDELQRITDRRNRLDSASLDRQAKYDEVDNVNRENFRTVNEMNKSMRNNEPSQNNPAAMKTSRNIKVVSIMNNNNLNEQEKMAALNNIVSDLSPSDYDYIMSRAGRELQKIKAWVVDQKKRVAA